MILINGKEIDPGMFPNGESIFTLKEIAISREVYMHMRYDSDYDIFALQMYKMYLDDLCGDLNVHLMMPYVPYSRMDRKIEGYLPSLKHFCDIINGLMFETVTIFDPHSFTTPMLLNNCNTVYPTNHVGVAISMHEELIMDDMDYIIYPDLGAEKKYTEVLKYNNPYVSSFSGNKKRDLKTGLIKDYDLIGAPDDLTGKNIAIVDDLCCKGFTFWFLAKKLKSLNAKNVCLIVSHCENSIYEGELLKEENKDLIDRIYTTGSILTTWNDVKLIEVKGFWEHE